MSQIYKTFRSQSTMCGLLLFLLCFSLEAGAKPLRVVEGSNSIETYARGLLTLVLSKLPEKYEIEQTIAGNSEERMVSMLMDNQLDVVWYATTNDLEERLQPIRICIYRGLLGYRVLMIKKGTQHKFDGIKNLEDLKRVSLGQGRFWADTNVLTANHLNVVKVLKYEGLFYMLDGERFDAFPRGAHEPWSEMQRYPKLALDVEQNLLISYTNPFYFFVNKSNTKLAAEIERGLRIAIEDGSFDEYFFNDPTVQDVMAKANLKNRSLIKLDNPGLPKKTPVDDASLWFDPYSFTE
ncbi:MAG: transporter substrate-binding domain-containing protein [Cellvibrio sp.]|uniref:diguanylate cyclase n=1 Tax=Cellvibrio sp. TaxID=1965322 RepID=UPI002719084F|nr:transporter substrate-binding domain-containing protein [Cellvibrio sp.]